MGRLIKGVERYGMYLVGLAIALVALSWVLGQAQGRSIPILAPASAWIQSHISVGSAPQGVSVPASTSYHA
jgi:hypothetical protein